MTDRQLFMEKLRLALAERGISEDAAAFYLNDRFYDVLAQDSADNTSLDKVDIMADGIAAQLKDREGGLMAEKPKTAEPEAEVEPREAQPGFLAEDAPTIETFVPPELIVDTAPAEEHTITINSVIDEIFDEAAKETTAEIDVIPHDAAESKATNEQTQTVDAVPPSEGVPEPLSEYDDEYSDYSYAENGYTHVGQNEEPAYAEEYLEDIDSDSDFEELMRDDAPSSRLPDYIEEKPIPSSPMFWVLFGVSSPVWIALLIAGLAIFVSVWIALGALIAASIAAMIAVVAVGSIASLVGIVYGVIEVFSPTTLPMGIYNIGLGIISAGATMFVSILIYNFALRLLPWVIKLVGKLFRFVLKKLKQLFNHARRECAKS